MSSFFDVLFSTYIRESETHIDDSTYINHRCRANELEIRLKGELNHTQQEQLEGLIEAITSAAYTEVKAAFINGFKLGAKCMLEISDE